ncbi:MAG: Nif3-like dinuclear metal center hexameric protein [Clostridia bacterium]|nr:Nif3-like dinuclear metal center hexameric protein [Clostridia bacterium]
MKVKEIIDILNETAPPELAMSFDHVGLMTGSEENDVYKIMVCLDLDGRVLDEAEKNGCDMVVTHHPLIFHPVEDLTEDSVRGRLLCRIVRDRLNVFSAHTNLDFTDGGVNDALAAKLGLEDVTKTADMQHRYGVLEKSISFKEFAEKVDIKLGAEGVKCVVPDMFDTDRKINRVGVSCGSFDGAVDWIYENDIDVLVTGEVKHSAAIDLSMESFATVSAGHYPTEIWGAEALFSKLCEKLGGKVEIVMSKKGKNPLQSL